MSELTLTMAEADRIKRDLLVLYGRLYLEDPETFAPETVEVMLRWEPVFTAEQRRKEG